MSDVRWYVHGCLMYKVNYRKMEFVYIENPDECDLKRYLQRYRVANNVN